MICTPTDSHVPVAIECAKRDMALFIEKPLSNSLKRLDELEAIVDEKKLPTYVAYPLRHHEEIIWRTPDFYDTSACFFRCLSNGVLWPSSRKLNHVLLELDLILKIVIHFVRLVISDGVVTRDIYMRNSKENNWVQRGLMP